MSDRKDNQIQKVDQDYELSTVCSLKVEQSPPIILIPGYFSHSA
jgi:hypothetical protein